MERAKPSSIKRATALRYMGASGWQPDDATTALLDRAEEKILAAATPRAAVRRLPRAVFPPPELDCGTDLTRHLQGCDAVLLMPCPRFCWSRSAMSWKLNGVPNLPPSIST